jgi:hypothetical protein
MITTTSSVGLCHQKPSSSCISLVLCVQLVTHYLHNLHHNAISSCNQHIHKAWVHLL